MPEADARGDLSMRPFTDLANRTRGELLVPDDEGYDRARRIFNHMIDRRPAAILRCTGAADVRKGVLVAREHQLPLSVRAGGHSVSGSAVCEGGLMLDVSPMKGIRVDPAQRTAQAQTGLLLREFDHETQAFGLATTLGAISVTGIAGLTLGGGVGWLARSYGLTCDNVLAADVVTANGELITANAEENEDLYWALRGGGGNFGVVTSLAYRLHPVTTVLAGSLSFSAYQAREALRFYSHFASGAPDELSTSCSVSRNPDGGANVSIAVCYCGLLDEGERVLQPLRKFGWPVAGSVGPMSYQALQRGFDADFPMGRQHYWKSGFIKQIPEDTIDVMLEFAATCPSPYSSIGFQQMSGVAGRVNSRATAFAHRDAEYDFLILSQWESQTDSGRNIDWTRRCFNAMRPFLEEGVYVNNLGDQEPDRVRAAYGDNYERLAGVKARYDPDNFFNLNHNIAPRLAA